MSVLIFVGVLFVLILVHELGHFAVAKWFGMKVDEFGIGFPPKLFGIQKGETEYTLNLVPLGGFVKIQGEDAVVTHAAIDGERSFTKKSRFAQCAVLVAGVTMNVILAWVLFIAAFLFGVHTTVSESEASEAARIAITNISPDSPADVAGFPGKGYITEIIIGDVRATPKTPTEIREYIKNSNGTPITFTIEEDNNLITRTVIPQQGVIPDDPSRYALGVSFGLIDIVTYSPLEAVIQATKATANGLIAIVGGISALLVDAVTLTADLDDVSGPVGIAGLAHDATQVGFTSLMLFTAVISLNLAVINILPLPALDGGRLVIVLAEGLLRRQFNPRIISMTNIVGFTLLILLMVVVTGNDIARLI